MKMNVYDTANKLASEIKQSEEYANYKMAKQTVNLNSELKENLEKLPKIFSPIDYEKIFYKSYNFDSDTLIEFMQSMCEIARKEFITPVGEFR